MFPIQKHGGIQLLYGLIVRSDLPVEFRNAVCGDLDAVFLQDLVYILHGLSSYMIFLPVCLRLGFSPFKLRAELAPRMGVEPIYRGSKPLVLPLDYRGK